MYHIIPHFGIFKHFVIFNKVFSTSWRMLFQFFIVNFLIIIACSVISYYVFIWWGDEGNKLRWGLFMASIARCIIYIRMYNICKECSAHGICEVFCFIVGLMFFCMLKLWDFHNNDDELMNDDWPVVLIRLIFSNFVVFNFISVENITTLFFC